MFVFLGIEADLHDRSITEMFCQILFKYSKIYRMILYLNNTQILKQKILVTEFGSCEPAFRCKISTYNCLKLTFVLSYFSSKEKIMMNGKMRLWLWGKR